MPHCVAAAIVAVAWLSASAHTRAGGSANWFERRPQEIPTGCASKRCATASDSSEYTDWRHHRIVPRRNRKRFDKEVLPSRKPRVCSASSITKHLGRRNLAFRRPYRLQEPKMSSLAYCAHRTRRREHSGVRIWRFRRDACTIPRRHSRDVWALRWCSPQTCRAVNRVFTKYSRPSANEPSPLAARVSKRKPSGVLRTSDATC